MHNLSRIHQLVGDVTAHEKQHEKEEMKSVESKETNNAMQYEDKRQQRKHNVINSKGK